MRFRRIRSERKADSAICPQIHFQAWYSVPISTHPNAMWRLDVYEDSEYSRVWPKKSTNNAGSLRLGKGGAAGRTPEERAASLKSADQPDADPCARHIRTIFRGHSRLESCDEPSMRGVLVFFPLLIKMRKQNMGEKRERRTTPGRAGAQYGTPERKFYNVTHSTPTLVSRVRAQGGF